MNLSGGLSIRFIWGLHDGATIIPKGIDTRVATDMVHRETKSKAVGLEHAKVYTAFDL